jgi:hypothetical protein
MKGGWFSYVFVWFVRLNVSTAWLATGRARLKRRRWCSFARPQTSLGLRKGAPSITVWLPHRGMKMRAFIVRGFCKPSDLSSQFILSFHSQKVSIPKQLQRRAGGWALIIERAFLSPC